MRPDRSAKIDKTRGTSPGLPRARYLVSPLLSLQPLRNESDRVVVIITDVE